MKFWLTMQSFNCIVNIATEWLISAWPSTWKFLQLLGFILSSVFFSTLRKIRSNLREKKSWIQGQKIRSLFLLQGRHGNYEYDGRRKGEGNVERRISRLAFFWELISFFFEFFQFFLIFLHLYFAFILLLTLNSSMFFRIDLSNWIFGSKMPVEPLISFS